MVLEFHPEVKEEIQAAYDWYEARSDGLGERYLKELDAAFDAIAGRPQTFQVQSGNVRRCLVQNFPFGVLFKERSNSIIILAVMHLKRRPFYWLHRVT